MSSPPPSPEPTYQPCRVPSCSPFHSYSPPYSDHPVRLYSPPPGIFTVHHLVHLFTVHHPVDYHHPVTQKPNPVHLFTVPPVTHTQATAPRLSYPVTQKPKNLYSNRSDCTDSSEARSQSLGLLFQILDLHRRWWLDHQKFGLKCDNSRIASQTWRPFTKSLPTSSCNSWLLRLRRTKRTDSRC